MDGIYKEYYNKFVNTNMSSSSKNLVSYIESTINKINSLSSCVNSSSWKEKGFDVFSNQCIPDISKKTSDLSSNVNSSLVSICNIIDTSLKGNLVSLKDKSSRYDNLSEEEKKNSSLSDEISSLKSKIDNDIARIKSISAGGNGNIVFDVSSNDTSGVSTSTTTNSDLVISSDMDFKNIDTTNLTDAQKEEIRQAFIGNVDTDYYYVDKTAGRKAQTQRLFYDGKEISDLSKITIKKGETIRITVKLPNTGGKIEYLTRTTADGERGDNPNAKIGDRKWEHYFEGHSEPYVNKNDKNTFLHTNYYEWVITGKKSTKGEYIELSQTSFQKTDKFSEIKSMVGVKVKVED